ncbi:hypothetical protein NADFUDRAFT_8170, partial [Nadsonia fulvescens var. elongata DSM 6958]
QPGPQVFVSYIDDPRMNLAIEDYIFKTMPVISEVKNSKDTSSNNSMANSDDPVLTNNRLFLYVNSPCVVIGRNQNPWRECNLPILNSLKIPLIRRRSGGGTVVHDSGNVNFSVMTARTDFTRDRHARMIVDSINQLPPLVPGPQREITLNERFDIVDLQGNKLSGSAYKIERQRSYHHGTFLLNSKLDVLRALLHRNTDILGVVEGKGVESVSSPVANLELDKDVFIQAAIDGFKNLYGVDDAHPAASNKSVQITPITLKDIEGIKEIETQYETLKTWDWTYGQTPEFTHTIPHPTLDLSAKFLVDKGMVKNAELIGEDAEDAWKTFVFVRDMINRDMLEYKGNEISGFIFDDEIGAWIGSSIDGS